MENTLMAVDDADYVLEVAAKAGRSVGCGDMIDDGRREMEESRGRDRAGVNSTGTMVFQCWIVADSQQTGAGGELGWGGWDERLL
jgi:hypothetical protein